MQVLQQLMQNLRDSDIEIRNEAIKQIYEYVNEAQNNGNPENYTDPQFIESLIVCLMDESTEVQSYALAILIMISAASAVKPLISRLKDANPMLRIMAVEALGKLGADKAVDPLIMCLHDKEASVRAKAAKALGLLKAQNALDPLLASLKDESPEVRSEAVKTLGLLQDSRVLGNIIICLMDNSPIVQEAAIEALKLLKEAAMDVLIDQLTAKNLKLRWQSAWALAEFGDPKTINPLLSYIKNIIINSSEKKRMKIIKTILQDAKEFAF